MHTDHHSATIIITDDIKHIHLLSPTVSCFLTLNAHCPYYTKQHQYKAKQENNENLIDKYHNPFIPRSLNGNILQKEGRKRRSLFNNDDDDEFNDDNDINFGDENNNNNDPSYDDIDGPTVYPLFPISISALIKSIAGVLFFIIRS